jgi:cytosine deaminase
LAVPEVLLRSVTLPSGDRADVRLEQGRIVSVGLVADHDRRVPATDAVVHDLEGWLVLPAPAEPHAHLDKAFTADLVANPGGDLLGAIEAWIARYPDRTVEEIYGRARRAALAIVANGATAIRTHVDVNEILGTIAVEALDLVKRDLAGVVDLQLIGLVGRPTSGPAGVGNRKALVTALEFGLDGIGAAPHVDADPAWVVDYCLDVAADAALPVDLHVDENLDPASNDLDHLARRVLEGGFGPGVTASHCVALAMREASDQKDVATRVAEAGISVVTLPQTNLFLQARGRRTAPPRGLTAVASLLDAGVNLAAGGDNLQDPFNSVGRADPLETAALAVVTAHLDPETAYHLVTNAARRALGLPEVHLEPGDPADLLLVRAANVREAVALAPADRLVIRNGELVARTTTHRELLKPLPDNRPRGCSLASG